MKFPFLFSCWLISCGLHAQSWCPPGANFKYNAFNYAVGSGYYEVAYLKDTLIATKGAKILHQMYHGPGMPGPISVDTLYVAESNGLVAILNANNQWDTLFVIGGNIGLQWNLHVRPNTMNVFCGSPSIATIIDTGSRDVLGVNLRYSVVNFDYGNAIGYQATDTIFERIGPRATFLLPYAECWPEGYVQALRCYEDNAFGPYLFQFSGNCNQLSVEEPMEVEDWYVYPNPVQSILHVPVSEPTAFIVYSIRGERMLEGVTQGDIQLGGIKRGMYVLALGGRYKRFVKE